MAPKAIYIGAGLDVARWVNRLPEIDTFVFLDSQPNSEHGVKMGFSRPWFTQELEQIMTDLHMIAVPARPGNKRRREFKNTTCRIIYYINTSYPEHVSLCDSEDLADFSHLIAAGHDPRGAHILQYSTLPRLHFIGTTGTVYAPNDEDEEDQRGLFQYMHHQPRFAAFTLWNDDTNHVMRLSSWREFTQQSSDGHSPSDD
tara:strand:- start:547 stop:1146 length:600 start_codon:yes stop_codon:yes gene_type:complete